MKVRKAKGTLIENDMRQIAVRLTQETFDAVSEASTAANRCFSEQLLYYVGLGMDRCQSTARKD